MPMLMYKKYNIYILCVGYLIIERNLLYNSVNVNQRMKLKLKNRFILKTIMQSFFDYNLSK